MNTTPLFLSRVCTRGAVTYVVPSGFTVNMKSLYKVRMKEVDHGKIAEFTALPRDNRGTIEINIPSGAGGIEKNDDVIVQMTEIDGLEEWFHSDLSVGVMGEKE